MSQEYNCYFDASFTPEMSRCAYYIQKDEEIVRKYVHQVKVRRTDIAEANALSFLLSYIRQKIPHGSIINIYGDALGVIESINRNNPRRYLKIKRAFWTMKDNYEITLSFIPRNQNLFADMLASGVDTKTKNPNDLHTIQTMSLDDIVIPFGIMASEPNANKVLSRVEYYKQHGRLYKNIEINNENVLLDGYISYLILKEKGIESWDVDVYAIA